MNQEQILKHENMSCYYTDPPMFRGTDQSAGYDIPSAIDIEVFPGETVSIPTGITVKLPRGCFMKIFERSSMAMNGKTKREVNGIMVDSTMHSTCVRAGVIDSDYPGELMICFTNCSATNSYFIKKGDRIAQGIILTHGFLTNGKVRETNSSFVHSGFGSTN